MTGTTLRPCGTKKLLLGKKGFIKRLGSCEPVSHRCEATVSSLNPNPHMENEEKTRDKHGLV